jgi:hypothetical protein
MYDSVRPDEAAQALDEIGQRQEQVIRLVILPNWFWWAIAVLMVGESAAADSGRPLVIGVGTTVFVLGVLAVTAAVVQRGVRSAQVHRDLLKPTAVLAILGLVAAVLAVTLPTAFALKAAGASHPATWGTVAGGLVMAIGGPLLMRALQRMMLDNRSGIRP